MGEHIENVQQHRPSKSAAFPFFNFNIDLSTFLNSSLVKVEFPMKPIKRLLNVSLIVVKKLGRF